MGCGDSKNSEKYGADFNTWLYKRLSTYFEDIETYICDYKISEAEVKKIEVAVEECVTTIMREVEFIDKKFTVKKNGIKKVGSFFEKTDVINLDKVTFYVAMRALSRPDLMAAYNVSEDKTNELHRVYFRGDNIDPTWVKLSSSENLTKLQLRSVSGLVVKFNDLVVQAVTKLRENAHDKWDKLELTEGYAPLIEDAAVNIKCNWGTRMEIRVSIAPVIEFDTIDDYVSEDRAASQKVFRAVQKAGSVLFVPAGRTSDSFFLSLAQAEVDIMKNGGITYSHRRVYKILKFIIKGYNESIPEELQIFRNKSIKALVIHHDIGCHRCAQVADCIMSVLSDMLTLLSKDGTHPRLFIPSIYDKNVNVLGDISAKPSRENLDLNRECLEGIIDHFTKQVGSLEQYEFNKTVQGLVPLYVQLARDQFSPRTPPLSAQPKVLAIY